MTCGDKCLCDRCCLTLASRYLIVLVELQCIAEGCNDWQGEAKKRVIEAIRQWKRGEKP